MSLDETLQEMVEGMVEGLERAETLGKRHHIFTVLCQSWGLKPGERVQLLMEIAIATAVDSKKDESSSEELLGAMNEIWAKKIAQTRKALRAYQAIKDAREAEAAAAKPEGHC